MKECKCKKCQCGEHVKNGIVNGKQRYKCKNCGCNFTEEDKRRISARIKTLAYLLYLEGMSFRGIERVLKVSHTGVMKWVKTFKESTDEEVPEVGERKLVQLMQTDEVSRYMNENKRKTAMDRS